MSAIQSTTVGAKVATFSTSGTSWWMMGTRPITASRTRRGWGHPPRRASSAARMPLVVASRNPPVSHSASQTCSQPCSPMVASNASCCSYSHPHICTDTRTLSLWPSRWCVIVSAAAINGSVARLETEAAIQQAIMTAGPVQAAFAVWSDFMQYKTGVDTQPGMMSYCTALPP